MKIIGLTGPTGSGKSALSKIAERLNYSVIDCDKVAREVSDETEIINKLADVFGNDILENGVLNRKALASVAFATKEKTELLNSIMLPEISKKIEEIMNTLKVAGKEYILLDAPTLYESGIDKKCDAVIAVLADEKVRKQRIIARDNLTEQQAMDRLSASKEDNFYKEKTVHILYNNGDFDEFSDSAEKILKNF